MERKTALKLKIMNDDVTLTMTSNAGVLLEFRGKTLLVDGIFRDKIPRFSGLKEEIWNMMIEGEPPFEHIDHILFTHSHGDHFSPGLTMEYISLHEVKSIFLPDVEEIRESGVLQAAEEKGVKTKLLSGATDGIVFDLGDGIRVRAFRTLHLDERYRDVLHICYMVSCGEKKILFTGDVDYLNDTLQFAEGTCLRAAFINPLFLGALETGRLFKGLLEADNYLVYHIPFEEDDTLGIRRKLLRTVNRWNTGTPPIILMSEAMSSIVL